MPRSKNSKCHLCDNEPQIAGLCKACYNSTWYWSQKTPGQMVQRMHDLDKYKRRMEMLTGNVRTAHRRRKAG